LTSNSKIAAEEIKFYAAANIRAEQKPDEAITNVHQNLTFHLAAIARN
jgi:hypothetical protein